MTVTRVKIKTHEKGLLYRDGSFEGILPAGTHWIIDPFHTARVDVVSMRSPWLEHPDIDLFIKAGALEGLATVIEVGDRQRALSWIDGRFHAVHKPGRLVYWHGFRDVQVEVVEAGEVRLVHPQLGVILATPGAAALLEWHLVAEGSAGLLFYDGQHVDTLSPGRYAFWRGIRQVRLDTVDLREQVLDVNGQEMITADKVTLRLNAVLVYRVSDPLLAHRSVGDVKQALYRDAQLALRAVVGTRDLDALLGDKDAVAAELNETVRARAADFGLAVTAVGIRDLILPGEMRELLNKVTQARKAAEANLIARREETAAVRNQANTARMLAENPTLMRLRELEVLERVADKARLQVVLGDRGLAETVVNLL